MTSETKQSSDQFSGRLGLIFATIGAAIGTGNIWRFPRMVGANGGGSFLVPWIIFLFLWETILFTMINGLNLNMQLKSVNLKKTFMLRK